MPAALPCPCCGEAESLYLGPQAALTMGVECLACGLSMNREVDGGEWPDDTPDGSIEERLNFAHHAALCEAVEAWNRRA